MNNECQTCKYVRRVSGLASGLKSSLSRAENRRQNERADPVRQTCRHAEPVSEREPHHSDKDCPMLTQQQSITCHIKSLFHLPPDTGERAPP